MKSTEFRNLALALPEAIESAHMGHPDFRVGGKVFASLGPEGDWGMVKLTPSQQTSFLSTERKSFRPASGAWGRRGCTLITLADADEAAVEQALREAWRNIAPPRLVQPANRRRPAK